MLPNVASDCEGCYRRLRGDTRRESTKWLGGLGSRIFLLVQDRRNPELSPSRHPRRFRRRPRTRPRLAAQPIKQAQNIGIVYLFDRLVGLNCYDPMPLHGGCRWLSNVTPKTVS